jgi:hypothetical protein
MHKSSHPKIFFASRVYVLKETVIMERMQKIVDRVKIARGSPSSAMMRAFGSIPVDMAVSSKRERKQLSGCRSMKGSTQGI